MWVLSLVEITNTKNLNYPLYRAARRARGPRSSQGGLKNRYACHTAVSGGPFAFFSKAPWQATQHYSKVPNRPMIEQNCSENNGNTFNLPGWVGAPMADKPDF